MEIIVIVDLALVAACAIAYFFGLRKGAEQAPISKKAFGWSLAGLYFGNAVVWFLATDINSVVWGSWIPALITIAVYFVAASFSARYAATLNRSPNWGWWIWVPFGFIGMLLVGPKQVAEPA